MNKFILASGLLTAFVSLPFSSAIAFDVQAVLDKAAFLQQSRGYVSNHVEGGHTHFDIKAADGSKIGNLSTPQNGSAPRYARGQNARPSFGGRGEPSKSSDTLQSQSVHHFSAQKQPFHIRPAPSSRQRNASNYGYGKVGFL